MIPELQIADYTYNLPAERIAKHPLAERDESKLLVYKNGSISDHQFMSAPELLAPQTLLVFNNTRVVQARLLFEKTPGAKPIEVFCLEPIDQDVETAMSAVGEVTFECLVGNAKRWNDGLTLQMVLDKTTTLNVTKRGRKNDSFIVSFSWNGQNSFAEVLELAGKVPLPPYLKREVEDGDRARYQTVYAKFNGSVAAPTAGLHFTQKVLNSFDEKNIERLETTLHVGAGTFKPVSNIRVQDHEMHAEEIHVSKGMVEQLMNHEGDVISVGTTSTRTLESLYWLGAKLIEAPSQSEGLVLNQWEAYQLPQHHTKEEALQSLINYMQTNKLEKLITYTSLIIAPGYKFRVIDGLFTNFHQPGSTLMLLVAAAIGGDWKRVYNHALANNYRFLSYGDSNLYFIPEAHKSTM